MKCNPLNLVLCVETNSDEINNEKNAKWCAVGQVDYGKGEGKISSVFGSFFVFVFRFHSLFHTKRVSIGYSRRRPLIQIEL